MAAKIVSLADEIASAIPSTSSSPFNILLFGPIGAGKSSFVNTVLKAFSRTTHTRVARYAKTYDEGHVSGQSSVTDVYDSYPLPNSKIVLWDTYGWERTSGNYDSRTFQSYLRGKVRAGTNKPATGSEIPDDNANPENEIHTVIFFIPAELVQHPAKLEAFWEEMKEFYNIAERRKVQSLFVFSLLDQAGDFTREMSFEDTFGVKNWNSLYRNAVTVLSKTIKTPSFLPLMNYYDHQLANNVDKLQFEEFALRILKKSVEELPYVPQFATGGTEGERSIEVYFHQVDE